MVTRIAQFKERRFRLFNIWIFSFIFKIYLWILYTYINGFMCVITNISAFNRGLIRGWLNSVDSWLIHTDYIYEIDENHHFFLHPANYLNRLLLQMKTQTSRSFDLMIVQNVQNNLSFLRLEERSIEPMADNLKKCKPVAFNKRSLCTVIKGNTYTNDIKKLCVRYDNDFPSG